jgi:hypothetical protein
MRTVSAELVMRLGLSAFATFGLAAACESAPPSTRVDATASVQALIGDAACNSDTQCATVGVGAKACGGPEGYVAWSSARADPSALRAAAQREANAARSEQSARGMVSNCSMSPDPGAFCDISRAASGASGTCRLRRVPGSASPLVR